MLRSIGEEEKALLMDEYSTVPNYESIPVDAVNIPYLTRPLWRHQYQYIYSCLKTEASEPIVTKKGEVFYSTSGLLPSSTGTGKTATMLGLMNFGVDERPIKHNIFSTSLNFFMLNKQKREHINCSIVCSKKEIIKNAWIKDLHLFYPQLPYYEFDTVGKFKTNAKKSQEYQYFANYINQVVGFIAYQIGELKNGRITQGDFEMQMVNIKDDEITTTDEAEAYIEKKKRELDELETKVVVNEAVRIMRSHKVIFISKDSFHFLFNIFKKYTVDRLVFDEPQDIVITNQAGFRDYLPDRRAKFLKTIGKNVPFYEESPARFIWYVCATPDGISSNVSNHFINAWIDANDYVVHDYVSNTQENRMFPELVEKYVIKFPLSYILEQRPELQALVSKYKVKCRKNVQANIIRGLISDEVDTMLENDDYGAVMEKLSVSGSATNILDAAVEKIIHGIKKLQTRISIYDLATPAHIISKSNADLADMYKKLSDLKRKINIFRGNHMQGEAQDCSICFDTLNIVPVQGEDPSKRCVVHMSCMNCFHIGCFRESMKVKKECPMCREQIKSSEDIKAAYDENGRTIEHQVYLDDEVDHQKQMEIKNPLDGTVQGTKVETIKHILLSPKNVNGYVIPRSKVLLFINFASDTAANIDEIVKLIQQCGYNVRLPFSGMTIDQVNIKYPPVNGCRVALKKANSSIGKEINEFKVSRERWVWIFRSGKESSGLNFPFVDTSIQYADYGRQVIGRSVRMDRVDHLDLITLQHATDGEIAAQSSS